MHTYAACCVERFLTVKDGAAPRVGRLELQPMLQPFLTNLFSCLALDSSKENPHIMKCPPSPPPALPHPPALFGTGWVGAWHLMRGRGRHSIHARCSGEPTRERRSGQ